MTGKATTVRLDEGLESLIVGAAEESVRTPDVPELSQSAVIRILLRDAADRLLEGELSADALEPEHLALAPDALEDLIPKHRRAKYYRERRKDEGWFIDMKEGFEGRVRDQLGTRFQRGYSPEGIARRAETFIGEAWDYWARIEQDPETAEEKARYVRDVVEDLRREHDRLDVDLHEQWLSDLEESVTESDEQDPDALESLNWEILEDARERAINPNRDHRANAPALANEYGIPTQTARTALELVRPETIQEQREARGVETGTESSTPEEIQDTDSGLIAGDADATLPDHSPDPDPPSDLIETVADRLEANEPVRVDALEYPDEEIQAAVKLYDQQLAEGQGDD